MRYGGQEALMVFDDVFVPWDRVYMCGEIEFSGALVERFAGFHRQSYGGCKVGVGDVLIGAAALAADYNGAAKASHIKDKLIEMTHLNETLFCCGLACSYEGVKMPAGNYQIDMLLANVCKQNVTRFPYEIARLAEDIAGGLMVTMPSAQDLASEKIGPIVEKFFVGQCDTPTIDRMRVMRLIENLTIGAGAVGYRTESMHGAGLAAGAAHHDRPAVQPEPQEGAGQGDRRGRQAVGQGQDQVADRGRAALSMTDDGHAGGGAREGRVLRGLQPAHRPRRRRRRPARRRPGRTPGDDRAPQRLSPGVRLGSPARRGGRAGAGRSGRGGRPRRPRRTTRRRGGGRAGRRRAHAVGGARPRRDAQAQGVKGMDWKTDYAAKRTTAAEAIKCVKSGDRVVFAHACGEPLDLVDALVARAGELERVEINHMVAMGKGEYCRPEYADAFYHKSLFVGASSRQAVKDGRGDYIPVFFHEIPKLFCEGYLPPDVVLIQVSPPDKHGFCSFGISVDYTKPAAQVAKTVIAQVNPKMPRTHGDAFIHVSEIDHVVESDQDIIELQPPRIGPVEEAIGKHIAGLVEDGSCLQLGIGGIPDAVLLFLHQKNDLGIHSEMFSEGVVDLYNEGVITNSAKKYFPGKMVATFLMGTRRLYDFVDDNPVVNMLPVNITNDPYVIGHERPRRRHQLGHPGRPDGPGRGRLHGRRPVHRHRRPGRLRARRRPQPRRQGDHRAAVARRRRAPSAASSPRSRPAPPSPPCAPTSTTSSPSTGSRTCAASGCASAPRRSSRSPTRRSATRSGRRRPRCTGSAACPANRSPRRAESHGARPQRT